MNHPELEYTHCFLGVHLFSMSDDSQIVGDLGTSNTKLSFTPWLTHLFTCFAWFQATHAQRKSAAPLLHLPPARWKSLDLPLTSFNKGETPPSILPSFLPSFLPPLLLPLAPTPAPKDVSPVFPSHVASSGCCGGHAWSRTPYRLQRMSRECSNRCQIECQRKCQNRYETECQKECLKECQIECQTECQCQKERQIKCHDRCPKEECQIERQEECQTECQNRRQKKCQIKCQIECPKDRMDASWNVKITCQGGDHSKYSN